MQTIVTGLISVATASLFLGWLAYRVDEWPFVIVAGIGIAAMLADFVQSVRNPNGNGNG